jgi:sugar O-acyltransferase (sialic acid O-acetyltransferase NeuD family)
MKTEKIVIVGDSAFAEIAYEYFQSDSKYEVVGFSVELEFLKQNQLFGLPVVAFEDIETHFDPRTHHVYVAIVYTGLNRLRTRLSLEAKARGYRLASYISSRAFVWKNVQIGEHCFVFEDNTIQPFVKIHDNVVLWSGNHIGHHSAIGKNCFVASHAVISGFCEIGQNSFIGVNATLANNISVGKDTWIGPGVTIVKDIADGSLMRGDQPEAAKVSTLRFFRVKEQE